MSAEKNTTEKIEVQAVQTEQTKDAADKKQEMLCALLEKGKNSHNQLTYADIADILDSADLDKNQMDDMYELLMAKGIEIVSETEPEDFDVILAENPDVAADAELIVEEASEIDIESTIPKSIAWTIPSECILRR